MTAAESLASPVFELFSKKTVLANCDVEWPKSPIVDFQPLTKTDPAPARQKIMRKCAAITRQEWRRPTGRSAGPNAPRRQGRAAARPGRPAGRPYHVRSVDDTIHRAPIIARGVGQRRSKSGESRQGRGKAGKWVSG